MASRSQNVNELYQVLAELMDDLVFVVDEDEKVLYVNSCAARLLGLTPREVVGKTVKELFPPQNYLHQSRNLRHVFQSGAAFTFENLFSFPGREVWLETKLVPVRDRSGDAVAVLGISRDATDRRNREEAIIEAKREWVRAVDSIVDPIAVIGLDYRVRRVNKAMSQRLGLTPQEAIGGLCYELIHDRDEPPPFCPFLKLMDDGMEHVAEIHDGGPLDGYLLKVSPLRDTDGSLIGCIHVAQKSAADVTKANPDQGLRQSVFSLLKSIEYLTAVQDTGGTYLLIDSMPHSDDFAEMVGKSPSDLFDSFTASGIMEQLQQVMLRGQGTSRMARITLVGEAVSFLNHVSPIRGTDGRITAVATVSRKVDDDAWTKGDFAALTDAGSPHLTKREVQVLKLIALGLTSRQIGEKLFISGKTVETHRSRIMQKLDLHTTADLVKYSLRSGL